MEQSLNSEDSVFHNRFVRLTVELNKKFLCGGRLDIYTLWLHKTLYSVAKLFSRLRWKAYHKILINNH